MPSGLNAHAPLNLAIQNHGLLSRFAGHFPDLTDLNISLAQLEVIECLPIEGLHGIIPASLRYLDSLAPFGRHLPDFKGPAAVRGKIDPFPVP